jgi:hypothetical protein
MIGVAAHPVQLPPHAQPMPTKKSTATPSIRRLSVAETPRGRSPAGRTDRQSPTAKIDSIPNGGGGSHLMKLGPEPACHYTWASIDSFLESTSAYSPHCHIVIKRRHKK